MLKVTSTMQQVAMACLQMGLLSTLSRPLRFKDTTKVGLESVSVSGVANPSTMRSINLPCSRKLSSCSKLIRTHSSAAVNRQLKSATNKFQFYESALQDPVRDVAWIATMFEAWRSRAPRTLREDFCGTGFLCKEWALSDPNRSAVGVDLDATALQYGLETHIKPNNLEDRVQLSHADVLSWAKKSSTQKPEVVVALNFSHCLLPSLTHLKKYFSQVHHTTPDDGMFIFDMSIDEKFITPKPKIRTREFARERFQMTTEIESVDAKKKSSVWHMSFLDQRSGVSFPRAFRYQWQHYTVPQLSATLKESGFKYVYLYEAIENEETETFDYSPAEEYRSEDILLFGSDEKGKRKVLWTYFVAMKTLRKSA